VAGDIDNFTMTYAPATGVEGPAKPTSPTGPPLEVEGAPWLLALTADHDPTTAHHYGLYLREWSAYFVTLTGITTASIANWQRMCLHLVTADTVKKKSSALRGFLAWAVEQGLLEEAPVVPSIARRATGTPDHKRYHKLEVVPLTMEEALSVIAELSDYSPGSNNGTARFPLRDRFLVALYTALRPATLDEITFPEDYRRGSPTLTIRDSCDKVRWGRTLPLCVEAREALDRVTPEVGSGRIFGHHHYGNLLRAAARRVLDPERAERLTPYDLRHCRLTWLCEHSNNLVGVSYLSGHKDIATLSRRYVHASKRAAESVLKTTAKQLSFADLLDPLEPLPPKGGQR